MATSAGGRALPDRNAVGGGAQPRPRRRPLDLDELAMRPNGSPGFGLVERFEGRAALAVRVAAGLLAVMPSQLAGGPAVAWLMAAMAGRGFTRPEIRAALPSASIPTGRSDRRDRKERTPGAERREPTASAENNPNSPLRT
jgi:hypothetical protein